MAKGKNQNPADSFRKAQRKKELKKNKTERAKKRDFSLAKQETWEQQDEIEKIKKNREPTAAEKARLQELEGEVSRINAKKEEYLKEHPEHRRLIYRPRPKEGEKVEEVVLPTRKLFKKNGLPRHPERSIYYDPVMNPFGVAPPGQPYMERALRPDEEDSQDEGEDDNGEDADDSDIEMPEGPPPGSKEELVESDDEIAMPDGLPPGSLLEGHPSATISMPPLPPYPTFPPQGHMSMGFMPPPPPPPGFQPVYTGYVIPPGPPPFPAAVPPPGFYPRSTPSMPNPQLSMPHHTISARPINTTPSASGSKSTLDRSAATVFAEPELRDFKKEATTFVPAALKRKKAPTATPGSAGRINAAPELADGKAESNDGRPDLMSVLGGQFGFSANTASEGQEDG